MLLATVLPVAPAVAGVGEGTATISTNESWGCGQPSTDGSYATRIGSLPDWERIGGPRADLLGRTIGQVRGDLVDWAVPMSGAYTIRVHSRALPAFEQVAVNLAVEQAKGNYYAIRPSHTYGFTPRTIGGRYQISLHAHGVALDINSTTNPYRSDNVLVTDMPGWFVKAWTDAGFCWGGDWKYVKDPMHFAWMGPAATPGYEAPGAYPVSTGAAGFGSEVMNATTEFGSPSGDYTYLLGDGDSDGVADVFQLVPRDNGTRLEYSQTDRNHDWCAVGRDHALDIDIGDRTPLLGDYSRVGRNDLVLIDSSGATLEIEVSLKPTGFEESITIATGISAAPGDVYLLGDHNRDSYVDLYVIRRNVEFTTLEVYSGADDFATQLADVSTPLGATSSSLFTLGDINLDELPDLFVVTPEGSSTRVQVLANGYDAITSTYNLNITSGLMDVLVNDYDGDGRGDLWFLEDTGQVRVRLGNTRLSGVPVDFWHNDPNWDCDPEALPYTFNGTFRDDDENVHEGNIEIIAAAAVTKGCNPPFNDDYCPDDDVSRGAMAAFLVRALGLTDDGGRDWFSDDDDQVFEDDINKLAAAGITRGCNPAEGNTNFCPEKKVTRQEMAAFLVRAFGLTDGVGDNSFTDDDDSIFESHIDRLAAAGITRGCNPAEGNTKFCPYAYVGRDEMASFISRSLPFIDG
ncbi:MAG: M15 family metallopeptidase [Acidimicrobiia bacterium]|nr:M15 family metallopeptidase [Acidimicrobiia bacterium]